MYDKVHDHKPSGWGGVLAEGVPTVDEHGDVMVPVQKDETLLAKDNEYGVAEFRDLKRQDRY